LPKVFSQSPDKSEGCGAVKVPAGTLNFYSMGRRQQFGGLFVKSSMLVLCTENVEFMAEILYTKG
jgi:hypothetical protein